MNGFVFSERKVAKAISRYDTPTLAYRLRKSLAQRFGRDHVLTEAPASPKIPPELSHHLIEIRTPPLSYQSLQLESAKDEMAQRAQQILPIRLNLSGRIWPKTSPWRNLELSVARFAGA